MVANAYVTFASHDREYPVDPGRNHKFLWHGMAGAFREFPQQVPCRTARTVTGTSTIVSIVPKASLNMIATASDTQNTSCSSGAMPNTVVAAALTTGRKRETVKGTEGL